MTLRGRGTIGAGRRAIVANHGNPPGAICDIPPSMNTPQDSLRYREGNDLDLEVVMDLYRRSTLAERRPIDDRAIFADMLRHANLVITAWDGSRLIGIARSLTDFAYVAYLSDLAVDLDWQRRGVGTRLMAETRLRMGPRSSIVLLAAPAARDYYGKVGFKAHSSAWVLAAGDPLG